MWTIEYEHIEFLGCVEAVLQEYIPHQLLKEATEKRKNVELYETDIVKFYIDNSNNKLRMYGTAEQLEKRLKTFWNFPMRYKMFETDFVMVHNSRPQSYRTLKGCSVYCKQDFLFYLQASIYNTVRERGKNVSSVVMEYMKKHEERVDKCFEFVEYSDTIFRVLQQFFHRVDSWNENFMNPEDAENSKPEPVTDDDYIELFEDLISECPQTFLPNSEAKSKKSIVAVRIFESRQLKFVMKSELFNAINFKNPDCSLLKSEDEDGFLRTIEMKDVYKTYRKQITEIDFIRTPIENEEVPIPTPNGDFCVLAVNGLERIYSFLSCVLNIFQRFNSDTWKASEGYMDHLKAQFPLNINCPLFINVSTLKRIVKLTEAYWNLKNGPSIKSVRDVGPNGFSLEDFNEELKYLGITSLSQSLKKFEPTLLTFRKETTADMFNALNQFFLFSIKEAFPEQARLLHSLYTFNPTPPPSKSPKFESTKWAEHRTAYLKKSKTDENAWMMEISKELALFPSALGFDTANFFLLDQDEIDILEEEFRKTKSSEILVSLEDLTKSHKKRIYIRAIPSTVPPRVLTDDVIDIIPILLKQQNTPLDPILFNHYSKKWEFNDGDEMNSISLDEFNRGLKEFDIDKSRITIVPDPIYKLTTIEMSESALRLYRSTLNRDGHKVMDPSEAIFHVFQMVICRNNWNVDNCKKHKNCKMDLKRKILELIEEYDEVEEGVYLFCESVTHQIVSLQSHCSHQNRRMYTVDEELDVFDARHEYPTLFYVSRSQMCGLTVISSKEWNRIRPNNETTPVWLLRSFYMVGWLDTFFEEETKVKKTIRETIAFKIPEDVLVEYRLVVEELLKMNICGVLEIISNDEIVIDTVTETDAPEYPPPVSDSKESEDTVEITVKSISKDEKLVDSSKIMVKLVEKKEDSPQITVVPSPEISNSDQPQKVTIPPRSTVSLRLSLEGTELERFMERKTSEIERLRGWLKTSEKKASQYQKAFEEKQKQVEELMGMLRESEDELKENQELLKTKEKKEKELENKLKISGEKMKKFEKTLNEKQRRIENLETSIKKLEEKGKRATEMEKNRKEKAIQNVNEIKQLKIRINEKEEEEKELTLELNNSKLKLHQLETTVTEKDHVIQSLQESTESLISQQTRVISELQQTISIMTSQYEEQGTTIKRLLDRFSSIRFPLAPGEPSALRCQLLGLQKIKDNFRNKSQLNFAKEMVQKLISSSDRPEIHQMANYEYEQYEGKIRNYMQEVEKNIQILKRSESGDVTALPSLPDFPSFSDRFIKEYWLEIDKQKTSGELQDSECLICLAEMKSEEKTLKCEQCRKVIHLECASKWLKIHRSCPHCRQKQLDPEDFPNL